MTTRPYSNRVIESGGTPEPPDPPGTSPNCTAIGGGNFSDVSELAVTFTPHETDGTCKIVAGTPDLETWPLTLINAYRVRYAKDADNWAEFAGDTRTWTVAWDSPFGAVTISFGCSNEYGGQFVSSEATGFVVNQMWGGAMCPIVSGVVQKNNCIPTIAV